MMQVGSTTLPWTCQRCGGAIGNEAVFLGSFAFHPACAQSPYQHRTPDPHGCRELRQITEADVRRIVREELAAAKGEAP